MAKTKRIKVDFSNTETFLAGELEYRRARNKGFYLVNSIRYPGYTIYEMEKEKNEKDPAPEKEPDCFGLVLYACGLVVLAMFYLGYKISTFGLEDLVVLFGIISVGTLIGTLIFGEE